MDPTSGQVSIADSGNLRSKSYLIALCAADEGGKLGRSLLRVDVKTRSEQSDKNSETEEQFEPKSDENDSHLLKDFDVGVDPSHGEPNALWGKARSF